MKPSLPPVAHSLRARLTLWHALVLGAVLVVFTLAVYGLLAHSLRAEVDRSLADRARQVNSAIRLTPPFRGGVRVQIPRPGNFASADTFVQVVSIDGHVVGASENLGDQELPVTANDLAMVRAGRFRYSHGELEGAPVRLFSAPLLLEGRPVGLIQVARSLDSVQVALGKLRLLAGGGLIVALGLSSLVVWLTTGAALRPLDHVAETAEAIGSSGDLTRRVSAPTADDEVGRLASTFNRMLQRLETSAMALHTAYQKVENALGAQRRFVADASHELRTPLTTIRSNASLLCQFSEVTPEDREAALAQISQEAERMSRLVQGLLTLARTDAGQSIERAPVALGPLIEDVVAQVKLVHPGQHRITTEIRAAAQVSGDADALRQLLWILLDNAVKYTPPGGEVMVRLEECDGEACMTVSDTGTGITAEDLPHIFERFYRADRSRKAGGTGLGLAIARGIVEQHGGAIHATSAPGQGATFTVRLPRLQSPGGGG